MAYCYECGSEVAPDDVFCPYCGISLKPFNVGEPAIAEAVPAFEQAKDIESNKTADVAATRTDDYSLSDTGENWNLPTVSVDFAAKNSTVADETKEIARDSASDESSAPSLSEDNQRQNFSAQTDSADLRENEQKVADQNSNIENIENLPEKSVEAEIEDEFAATVPYIPLAHDNQERFAAKMAEEPKKQEREQPLSVLNDGGKINENIPSPMQDEIAKPIEDLEIPAAPPSVFDSVRIMEKQAPPPKFAGNVFDSAAQSVPVPMPPAASTPPIEKPKDVRSHTTPNIGGTDSGGKRSAKLKPLEEGTILNGRYEIIRKIGGGGMGAVYLASDNNLGGVLRAVKEMVQSYIEDSQQEKAINDFKRESMILSTLDHSAIPTIYDYFYDEAESRFYLVMKYISGGDLAARLRATPEGRIDEKIVTEWAIQIADVLDYLHNRPTTIVYRDLKPANVMVDGNSGRAMLIDFGIARSVNKEEKGVTAVGTMGYAPPELFSGNVEPRSDIYSLGSTMFHLLTGADPQSNPLLIFDFQKNPRPRQINPSLSDQMEKILMRAVEYNSHARFASAAEMRRVLEDHLENLKTGRVTFGVRETPASVGLENQPVFCGFCGQRIMATDMFCAFCGARQPLSQKGVHAEIYSPAAATARLMILGTNELDSPVFTLEKDENLVGRRDPQSNIFPEIDLSKFDPQTKISRRHARVWREGANFMVEDLGSSNGTVVIGASSETVKLLPRKPRALTSGDKIRLGDTTLHFVLG